MTDNATVVGMVSTKISETPPPPIGINCCRINVQHPTSKLMIILSQSLKFML